MTTPFEKYLEVRQLAAAKTASSSTEWIDGVLERMRALAEKPEKNLADVMPMTEVIDIIQAASEIFKAEGSLCEIAEPAKIIPDIRENYQHLQQLFSVVGHVPGERLVFIGGRCYFKLWPSGDLLEVLVFLLCLKIRWPEQIILLRRSNLGRTPRFHEECLQKYGTGVYWDFMSCFNCMPLGALIGEKVLCWNEGLACRQPNRLDIIENNSRPGVQVDKDLIKKLVWEGSQNPYISDEKRKRIRDCGDFGIEHAMKTCAAQGLDLVTEAIGFYNCVGTLDEDRRAVHEIDGRSIKASCCDNCSMQINEHTYVVCVAKDKQISFQFMKYVNVSSYDTRTESVASGIESYGSTSDVEESTAESDHQKQLVQDSVKFKKCVEDCNKKEKPSTKCWDDCMNAILKG